MTDHASVVKDLHKVLRNKFKSGVSEDVVWKELIYDKEVLQKYSTSMHSLASSTWKMDNNNRIKWCEATILHYFNDDGLIKSLRKELKTQHFQKLNDKGVNIETKEIKEKVNVEVDKILKDFQMLHCLDKKLLLDVGSCFNPFDKHTDCHIVAVDIAPATDDVIFCDFLNLKIENKNVKNTQLESIKKDLRHGHIPGCLFDVVVFSLLLSYFPSPRQRLQCCLNAYFCLNMNGLLLVITPDSSHQNKHVAMMRSWKSAFESIGFVRFKYEKLDHLHCMAYRKSTETVITPTLIEDLKNSFFIPQDLQEFEDCSKDSVTSSSSCEEYDSEIFAGFDL